MGHHWLTNQLPPTPTRDPRPQTPRVKKSICPTLFQNQSALAQMESFSDQVKSCYWPNGISTHQCEDHFLSLHEQSENVSSLGHILQFKLDLASSHTNRHMRFDSWLISQWPPWESCRLAARWIRAALCRTRPILRSNTGGACFKLDLKLLKNTY